jgi:hypothetical protein
VAFHEVTRDIEHYALTCLRCDHRWVAHYEVRYWSAGDDVLTVFYRGGVPVAAPWSGGDCRCPRCHDTRVQVVPASVAATDLPEKEDKHRVDQTS